MKIFPNKPYEERSRFTSDSSLEDYLCTPLVLDKNGNTLSGPDILKDRGDVFVSTSMKRDLECLLKPLPTEMLRDLSMANRSTYEDLTVQKPRRDDVLTVRSGGSRRKLCVYNIASLVGHSVREGEEQKEVDDFVEDLRKFTSCRPIVGSYAKHLLSRFVTHSLVDSKKMPYEVLRLFYLHGRGGNMDTSVIGCTPNTVKVDQNMSYFTIMSELPATVENQCRGRYWTDEVGYDAADPYGIYCVDVSIDESLPYTPISVLHQDTYINVTGKLQKVVVMKPTMETLLLLQKQGLAKIGMMYWCWRLHGYYEARPFKKLYDMILVARYSPLTEHAHYFLKLVPAALWGLTLQTYPSLDYKDKICGYWFNPVIAYTTTDKMRQINFLMRLKSEGKVSAEVVDMMTGSDGQWYKGLNVKVKGPFDYYHIGPQYHIASTDDKLGLLDEVKNCSKPFILRKTKSRLTLNAARDLSSSAIKEAFGSVVETTHRVQVNGTKMRFPTVLRHMSLKELMNPKTPVVTGRPFTVEELSSGEETVNVDWNSMLFELTGEAGMLFEEHAV